MRYKHLHQSGIINMLDSDTGTMLTGLSADDYVDIINNYKEYHRMYVELSDDEYAQLMHARYQLLMSEVDDRIKSDIEYFCKSSKYAETFGQHVDMLINAFQANHSDDELNLLDKNTGNVIPVHAIRCSNIQLVKYGCAAGIPSWFDITWNFNEFSDCTMPNFCYDVLDEISKKDGMKMELNGKDDVNFIFATNMPVEDAFNYLISQYDMLADYLLDTMIKVADHYISNSYKL